MGDDLSIWKFVPRHGAGMIPEIAQLWLDSWRSTGTAAEEDVRVEDLIQRIREEVKGSWELTLCWLGPQLAGMLAIRPADNCLDQLFVAPNPKGSGVGSRLMDIAKQRLRDGMWLRTAEANHAARAFYERRGFHHYDTDKHPTLGYTRVFYRWP